MLFKKVAQMDTGGGVEKNICRHHLKAPIFKSDFTPVVIEVYQQF